MFAQMHKDPAPGLFKFSRRSLGYTIGAGALTGLGLSFLLYGGLVIWRADRGGPASRDAITGNIETSVEAAHTPTATPTVSPALQYR
ncbi:MAG: hypothetical protein M3Y80_09830 [Verrucomicrobiota bacterium]|nr:hypothetical protein [Verrucomicrobiota bacterium]